ncbi:hypothetical protein ACHAPT_009404 [Fusarium lateritium]
MDPQDLEEHTKKLRAAARSAYDHRMPFRNISSESHRTILDRAIKNVLSTELAQFTYAQIIDGLPTGDVAWDRRFPGIFGDHPIDEVHESLCPGAMEKAKEYYEQWDPEILLFDPKTVADYQHAEPGSRAFNVRLVELVAVTLHQIGALLYQLDFRLHHGDIESITNWRLEATDDMISIDPRPTLFNHHAYLDNDIYPEGVADIVGYWAEDRILGGVALFDRNATDPSIIPNIYFHSCREKQTFRLYQLRDDQQQALSDFLLADTPNRPPSPCPLPILSDSKNRVRVDPGVAIIQHHIYRDIWERKPKTREQMRFQARRPHDEIDYPEIGKMVRRVNKQLGVPLPKPPPRSPSR